MSRNRDETPAAKAFQKCSLGAAGNARRRVLEHTNYLVNPRVVRACFYGQRPLPDCGQKSLFAEVFRYSISVAEPVQPGRGKYDGVVFSLVKLTQPRVDIAANRHDEKIGSQGLDLSLPAQAAGANRRALSK